MKLKKNISRELPFFIVSLGFIWQILFFYLPLLFIIIISFMKYSASGVYQNFSFDNFLFFFKPVYFSIILKSILLAFVNATLCFIIGYPIAYFLSFKAGKLKNLFLFLLILPFWTNFLLHVYAWFYVLERTGFLNNLLIYLGIINKPLILLNSIWSVVLVMLYCYLPFMVLPIYSILERLNKNILEASADLGASIGQTWSRVILPLSIAGVQSGFFLVFIPSFGEFAIPGLVGGDKFVFVGTVITQYILSSRTISLGSAFTLISVLVLIWLIVLAYFIANKYFKTIRTKIIAKKQKQQRQ